MTPIRRATVASLVLFSALVSARANGPLPPATEIRPVFDRIHNVEFVDPYRWLEQQDAPEVRRWIDAQNAYADAVLAASAERAVPSRTMRRLMDRPDVGRAQRGGAFEYHSVRA